MPISRLTSRPPASQRSTACYGIFYPNWTGRFYHIDPQNPESRYAFRGFGLDGDGVERRAPIWNPPSAHGPSIPSHVRWPWQSPTKRNRVEIELTRTIARLSAGFIAAGFAYRIVAWLRPPKRPVLLSSVAWWLALGLAASWLGIAILVVVTMGYGATDHVVLTLLAIGALVGLVCGSSMHVYRTRVRGRSACDGNLGENALGAR